MLTDRQDNIRKIIRGCAANQRAAQEQLYKMYFDMMFHMCLKYSPNEDDAMTILNDGFLKVFKNINTLLEVNNVEAWIRRVIYNTIIDYHRKYKKYKDVVTLYDNIYDGAACTDGPDNLDHIFRLIDKLPDLSRDVFTKYAIEGYTHREISEQLQIKENTSKWHLFEARKKLKAWLEIGQVKKNIS